MERGDNRLAVAYAEATPLRQDFREGPRDEVWTFIPIPQATLGLPESGMCCGRTWQALLGADSEPRHIHLVLKPAAASSDGDGDGADSDGAGRVRR